MGAGRLKAHVRPEGDPKNRAGGDFTYVRSHSLSMSLCDEWNSAKEYVVAGTVRMVADSGGYGVGEQACRVPWLASAVIATAFICSFSWSMRVSIVPISGRKISGNLCGRVGLPARLV